MERDTDAWHKQRGETIGASEIAQAIGVSPYGGLLSLVQRKRDLRAGKATIDRLLESPPEYLETAKVFDLLLAVPKFGRVKANKILQQVRISPSKTVGGLSDRQRGELVQLLRSRTR
jgi:uncharacterized FAD-dependent dehydrogenase